MPWAAIYPLLSKFPRPEPHRLKKSAKPEASRVNSRCRAQTVTLLASKADFFHQVVLRPPPHDSNRILLLPCSLFDNLRCFMLKTAFLKSDVYGEECVSVLTNALFLQYSLCLLHMRREIRYRIAGFCVSQKSNRRQRLYPLRSCGGGLRTTTREKSALEKKVSCLSEASLKLFSIVFCRFFKRYVVLAEGTSDRKGYNSADIRFLTYLKNNNGMDIIRVECSGTLYSESGEKSLLF